MINVIFIYLVFPKTPQYGIFFLEKKVFGKKILIVRDIQVSLSFQFKKKLSNEYFKKQSSVVVLRASC